AGGGRRDGADELALVDRVDEREVSAERLAGGARLVPGLCGLKVEIAGAAGGILDPVVAALARRRRVRRRGGVGEPGRGVPGARQRAGVRIVPADTSPAADAGVASGPEEPQREEYPVHQLRSCHQARARGNPESSPEA